MKFMDLHDWYQIDHFKDDLIVIREKLDEVDPRFHTNYTNLYLLLGSDKALLIDTGSGVFPLKPLIDELTGEKRLLVLNTHGHWDHVGNNREFQKVLIHEIESRLISNPINISNLIDSEKEIAKNYENNNYTLLPPKEVLKLKNGDKISLGNINLEVIHNPGHSPGSISLLTNRGELFVADIAHEGAIFLPKKKKIPEVISSLESLIKRFESYSELEIYPGHEDYPKDINFLKKLLEGLRNIDNLWEDKKKDGFLRSWIVEDKNFKYIISKI